MSYPNSRTFGGLTRKESSPSTGPIPPSASRFENQPISSRFGTMCFHSARFVRWTLLPCTGEIIPPGVLTGHVRDSDRVRELEYVLSYAQSMWRRYGEAAQPQIVPMAVLPRGTVNDDDGERPVPSRTPLAQWIHNYLPRHTSRPSNPPGVWW